MATGLVSACGCGGRVRNTGSTLSGVGSKGGGRMYPTVARATRMRPAATLRAPRPARAPIRSPIVSASVIVVFCYGSPIFKRTHRRISPAEPETGVTRVAAFTAESC
ncbi:hypothetical protein GCM10010517_77150 [Streptosporangium fragile]|uniref:Uncharacterized protein n=1 Tax=Streptosporangium fragile TaxID=46186 RepID=A0ABN3WEV1_9ACTN